jgi:predicted transcriptional regulator
MNITEEESFLRECCTSNNSRQVLISIKKRWLDKILSADVDEEKTVEIRKSHPGDIDCPIDLLFYETKADGGQGRITAIAEISGFIRYYQYSIDILNNARIEESYYNKYSCGKPTWGWKLTNARRLANPVYLQDIRAKTPPQSWRYISLGDEYNYGRQYKNLQL